MNTSGPDSSNRNDSGWAPSAMSASFSALPRVQHTQRSLAVPHLDLVWGGVIPNVFRSALEMRGLQQLAGTATKDPALSIISGGDEKLVFFAITLPSYAARPYSRHQRAKKSRIAAAISFAWVSSAKWPVSKKWIMAPGISRLNASAPPGRKKGSFFPQTARKRGL